MNRESPAEVDAKQIVERVLGIVLEHADKNGGSTTYRRMRRSRSRSRVSPMGKGGRSRCATGIAEGWRAGG